MSQLTEYNDEKQYQAYKTKLITCSRKEKLGMLYNWARQGVIRAVIFRKLMFEIIDKEVRRQRVLEEFYGNNEEESGTVDLEAEAV